MSHEITIRSDGFAEATFARIPAWHQLAGHQGGAGQGPDLR